MACLYYYLTCPSYDKQNYLFVYINTYIPNVVIILYALSVGNSCKGN